MIDNGLSPSTGVRTVERIVESCTLIVAICWIVRQGRPLMRWDLVNVVSTTIVVMEIIEMVLIILGDEVMWLDLTGVG